MHILFIWMASLLVIAFISPLILIINLSQIHILIIQSLSPTLESCHNGRHTNLHTNLYRDHGHGPSVLSIPNWFARMRLPGHKSGHADDQTIHATMAWTTTTNIAYAQLYISTVRS